MSYKIGTYISLIIITCLAIVFYISAATLPSSIEEQKVGPDYFPKAISLLLVIFCVFSFITTKKREDQKLELVNLRYVIYTIVLTILYVGVWHFLSRYFADLWQTFKGYYIISFFFITSLIYIYQPKKSGKKRMLFASISSFILIVFIFLIFDVFLFTIF
ncbi:tripartite tricarboxylate transporter TctB family protein [Salirhabdus salicampi]|uniref:tripartite tricarboxylate transporter TctB family protein n=1 Tax=Salirhabdus salicampi TaxID=476102 RepID=UPI0020C56FC4|nr:tripartite tricarboxylate transporter TctB family protein [Salirhabdus salicampi]MCP8615661.1 tripartite tricarboxylate transporter TctB family protein [Salirhabdus salicampi]